MKNPILNEGCFNPDDLEVIPNPDFDPTDVFEIGAMVYLNSGGPPMMVMDWWEVFTSPGIEKIDGVWTPLPPINMLRMLVNWKDEADKLHEAEFWRVSLTRVKG